MHDEVVKMDTASLIFRYTENANLGIPGITLAAAGNNVDADQFQEELKAVQQHLDAINRTK